MTVLSDIAKLSSLVSPLHLAIGVFDSLHQGHQAVISQSIKQSKTSSGDVVVVSFDPHPASILAPQKAPQLLCSTKHKAMLLKRELGVANLLVVPFDRKFSELTGEAFIEQLQQASAIGSISVGEDFHFGKNRSGNVTLLQSLANKFGFTLFANEIVKINGVTASSTRVREAIALGDFEMANSLLGRDYTVLGTVLKGRQVGRTIGFPTANLSVYDVQLPPTGVYAVRVSRADDRWCGIANLGYRPTVENVSKRLLEVHLFDFSDDLYGEDLEVEFVRFIRPEIKFEGLEALKDQIQKDVTCAKSLFASS